VDLLRTRASEHELLDAPHLDPRHLRLNLREMAMLNRLPGGVGDSVRAIRRLVEGGTDAVVLDIGTGSGDLPRRLARLNGAGPPMQVIGADIHPEVLEVARRNLADTDGVTLMQADVRTLPLDDGAVDVAHASMVLHHLEPDDVIGALREMRRVAGRGVVVNDLRRGRLAFGISAAVVLGLTHGAYTRHDGVLSARRAYTLSELDELAARAGLARTWRSLSWLPRVTTIYQ
jgi:SAM-dependent methyltransferase